MLVKKSLIISLFLLLIVNLNAQDEEYFLLNRVKGMSFGSGIGESGVPAYFNFDIKVFNNFYTSPEIFLSFYKEDKYYGNTISVAWRFNYVIDDFIKHNNKNSFYVGIIFSMEKWLYDYKHRDYFPKRDANKVKLAIGMRHFIKNNWYLNAELVSLAHNEIRIGLYKKF